MNNRIRITTLVLLSLLVHPLTANSTLYEMTYTGWFTLYDAMGNPVWNSSNPRGAPMLGWRTPVTGVGTWDDETLIATDDIDPFMVLGWLMTVDTVVANPIGDGFGGPGNLILGNTLATWANTENIPISNVADATGIFDAIESGVAVGDVITGGVLPATNDTYFGDTQLPLGIVPFASTFFNTTPVNDPVAYGDNPSGRLPLINDGIPGSTMHTLPFDGFSGGFDITQMQVSKITPTVVPVPAAIWMFISGGIALTGLMVSNRKKINIVR